MPVHYMKCNGDPGDPRSGYLLWFPQIIGLLQAPYGTFM